MGYIGPSPQLDHVYVITDHDSVHINLIEIVSLYRVNKGIWSRMDGGLSAGFSYQASNQLTQLSLGGNATYRGERGAINFSFNSITTVQTDVEDARKQDISLGWNATSGTTGPPRLPEVPRAIRSSTSTCASRRTLRWAII